MSFDPDRPAEPLPPTPTPTPTPGGAEAPDTEDGRSYEAAAARIEQVIRRLDSGDAGLRETLELVREGRELVEWCAAELEAVGRGLEELRLDELVARLEGGGQSQPPGE